MKQHVRVGWLTAIFSVTVVTVMNIYFFVSAFPGVVPKASAATTTHLPLVADAYRAPSLPAFVHSLTAESVYVTAESPWPKMFLARRADEVIPLASLTKLMSALVVLDAEPDWSREVVITAEDRRGGARTPLTTGAHVTVEDLWTMSLMSSDNDATAALARHIAGSEEEFVARMNAKAATLGLEHTVFFEPTGLSAKNTGSARDVAAIARRAFAEARIRETLARDRALVSVSGRSVTVYSSDQVVKTHAPYADGWSFVTAKTGFVDESGYNLALLGKAASGEDLLLVLMGSATIDIRAEEAEDLFAWAAATLDESNE